MEKDLAESNTCTEAQNDERHTVSSGRNTERTCAARQAAKSLQAGGVQTVKVLSIRSGDYMLDMRTKDERPDIIRLA